MILERFWGTSDAGTDWRVIGIALTWGLCLLISTMPTPVQQLRMLSLTPLIALLSMLVALLIGLASG